MEDVFLPENFNVRAAGGCMTAARIIAGKLLERGESPVVVEGWIQFIDDDGSTPDDMKFEHTWVEGDDIIDPTLEQFGEYLDYFNFDRVEKERIPAAEYLSDSRLNADPKIFFDDGVIPDDCQKFLDGLAANRHLFSAEAVHERSQKHIKT